MTVAPGFKRWAVNLGLSLTATLACLVALEGGLRVARAAKGWWRHGEPQPIPLHVVLDSPILYGLNPAHPEINAQGVRDTAVAIPKPKGTFRILVLGDSVAYGPKVAASETFPNRLEALLKGQPGAVEVINAGVSGYSTYNEWQYYLEKGRQFEPDIVIVAFCMNDVVNPRLHWGSRTERIKEIPLEAIPNHTYDRESVLPRLKQKPQPSLLQRSMLYRAVADGIGGLRGGGGALLGPERVPTHITGEDSIGIDVLLDESSPEWRWLTSIYRRLRAAVEADGAAFVLTIAPLAYQLDPDYPFLPQEHFARYCEEESMRCIDLLPAFRKHRKEDLFLLKAGSIYDVWHFTRQGHQIAAEEILRFLQQHGLVPPVQ